MRTLFVHVGPAKTGTSAVQHYFCSTPSRAVAYPHVGLWADGSHHNLVLSFFGDNSRPEARVEPPEVLFAQLREVAAQDERDMLLSSEALARHDGGEFIGRVSEELGLDRLVVICVCREHFERASSLYNQMVKDAFHSEVRDPSDYVATSAKSLTYRPLVARLTDAGFELRVLSYHPSSTLVQRFADCVGHEPEGGGLEAPQRNVSLAPKGLIPLLLANRLVPDAEERKRCFERLQRLPGLYQPSRFIFDPCRVASAAQTFEADRAFLRDRFGLELPEVNLDERQDAFGITPDEFRQIQETLGDAPAAGATILERLGEYVRG